MKAIVLVLIGLAVGAMCALIAANALGNRNAYQRAGMVVLASHVDAVQRLLDRQACDDEAMSTHLRQLAFAAREIPFAFPAGMAGNAEFARRANDLITAADGLAEHAPGCSELSGTIDRLDRICQECHRRYR